MQEGSHRIPYALYLKGWTYGKHERDLLTADGARIEPSEYRARDHLRLLRQEDLRHIGGRRRLRSESYPVFSSDTATTHPRSPVSHRNIALPFSQIATPPAHDLAYNEPQQLAATHTRIPTTRTGIRRIAKKLAQRIRRDTGRDRLLP